MYQVSMEGNEKEVNELPLVECAPNEGDLGYPLVCIDLSEDQNEAEAEDQNADGIDKDEEKTLQGMLKGQPGYNDASYLVFSIEFIEAAEIDETVIDQLQIAVFATNQFANIEDEFAEEEGPVVSI